MKGSLLFLGLGLALVFALDVRRQAQAQANGQADTTDPRQQGADCWPNCPVDLAQRGWVDNIFNPLPTEPGAYF